MLSYWEQQSFLRYDHLVIGGGIVGMSLALELRARFPQASIAVLERGLLPTGATTRNAGFACAGSPTELLDDLQHSPEADVVALFEARLQGLRMLRDRIGDVAMDYREDGSHELISPQELGVMDRLDYLNDLLMPVLGKRAFLARNERITTLQFNPRKIAALIEITCEGNLDSGKLMLALLRLARQADIAVMTGAHVQQIAEDAAGVDVVLADGLRANALRLRAETVSVCTNAFAPALLPGEDVTPGRGQVLITEPIAGLPFRGTFHMHQGYYYFRELHGRVLLGGGRHLDKPGETTTEIGFHEPIQQDLERQLREVILPGRDVQIAQRWSGIMAFGATKQPIVKAFGPRVFGAFRMGGMGVALGSGVAARLADIIAHRC